MELTLREYRKEDSAALEQIIRRTWKYDELCCPSTAGRMAALFLSACLTDHTFSRVAVSSGRPVGIILADNKAKHKFMPGLQLRYLKDAAALFLSKDGRKVSKFFKTINDTDRQLLSSCGKKYPAELALFAVDPDFRGLGVGKRLFQSVLDYLHGQQLDEFYLFTDTTCNYGFYEHQGMTRKNETLLTFNINGRSFKTNFFIYDYKL